MCGGQSNQCLISGSKQDNLILTNFLLIVCVLIANWRRNEIRVDWACGSARSAIAWGFLYKQQFDAEIIQINGNGKYFHDSSEPQNGCSPVSLCILEPRRHHTLIHRGRQSFWTYFLFKTNTTCEWRSAFQATLSYYYIIINCITHIEVDVCSNRMAVHDWKWFSVYTYEWAPHD